MTATVPAPRPVRPLRAPPIDVRPLLAVSLLALVLAPGRAAGAAEVPFLTGRVNDYAEILSPAARETLAATLQAHEARTTNQVVVLTATSMDGASVEEYAQRVFAAWKLGQARRDNGVLVVVAPPAVPEPDAARERQGRPERPDRGLTPYH